MLLKQSFGRHERRERELDFEGLERRVMLAASIDGTGHLTIDGTSGDDMVLIATLGIPLNPYQPSQTILIQATDAVLAGSTGAASGLVASPVAGASFLVYTGVTDVTINTGDGADLVATGLLLLPDPIPANTLFSHDLNINLGDGVNTAILLRPDVEPAPQFQTSSVRIFGGADMDNVIVDRAYNYVTSLTIETFGGHDCIAVWGYSYLGNGLEISSGDGDDVILIEVTTGRADIDAGSGNDLVVAEEIERIPGDGPGAVITILGGDDTGGPNPFVPEATGDVLVRGGFWIGAPEVIDQFETMIRI